MFVRSVVVLSLAFAASGACRAVEVVNAAFSESRDGKPVGWTCSPCFRAEATAGHNGSGGVVYENANPEIGQATLVQSLKADVGVAYRFSCLVRTEGFAADGRNGIGVGIEWTDAGGKFLGGTYAKPQLTDANAEWTLMEGMTRELPPETDSMRFVIFVQPKCTGKAAFDNVAVSEVTRDPVAYVFSSAYRGVAAEGEVRFHAALFPPAGASAQDLRAEFRYVGADGTACVRAGELEPDLRGATLHLQVSELALGTNAVVCALMNGGVELGTAATDFAHVEVLPARKVWIDAHRRCIVDGEPFFPLGMYWGTVERATIETYAKGPFNCLLAASWLSNEGIGLCDEKGLKVIPTFTTRMLNAEWSRQQGYTTREQVDAELRGDVLRLKDHPSLLGWYVADESPVSEIPERTHMYRLLRELDPDHPTYAVQDRTYDLREFVPICDVMGVDPYPVCNPYAPSMKVGDVTTTAVAADRETFGDVAYWSVPQAFNWGLYVAGQEPPRMPTVDELRSMCWQHIAAGANGLVFYSFFDYLKSPETFDACWACACAVGEEIRAHIPVLLSVDPAPSAEGVPSGTSVRTWCHRGDLYVLAVNMTEASVPAQLHLSDGLWKGLENHIGAAGEQVGADRIALDLPPLGVSLVRLRPLLSAEEAPIVDTFEREAPGAEADDLAGWRGARAAVAAEAYDPPVPPGFVLNEASHDRVLDAQDGVAARTIPGTAEDPCRIDMMVCVSRSPCELPPLPADVQTRVEADPDGRLCLWHLYEDGGTWRKGWIPLSGKAYADGEWVRVGLELNASDNPDGDAFVKVTVNGSCQPTPHGVRSPTDTRAYGPWHYLAKNRRTGGVSRPREIVFSGVKVDDLVLCRTSVAPEHTGPTSVDGIAFSWFDAAGLPRDPTAPTPFIAGYKLGDAHDAGIDPYADRPLAVTGCGFGRDGRFRVEFNGYRGDAPSAYRLQRSDSADFSAFSFVAPEDGEFVGDAVTRSTVWRSRTAPAVPAAFYRIEASRGGE